MANYGICTIDGCGKPAPFDCGLCHKHYARMKRHGDPLRERRKRGVCSIEGCGEPHESKGLCSHHYHALHKRICSIEGCQAQVQKKGYCKMHFRRLKKYGDPLQEDGPTPTQIFIQKAISYEGDDCLIYPFATQKDYYVVVHIKIGGKTVIASRYICTQAHGEPPTPAHDCAHTCGNGDIMCLNARHLRWATKQENMADRITHGTDLRGEKSSTAILNRDDVRIIRKCLQRGESQYSIARRYHVSRSAIASIANKRSWGWLE